MKFANIVMTRQGRFTIGDDVQLLAIENLYRYMGINYDDVVRIPFNQLSTYDGEYVVLPISFPLYAYSHDDKITQYSERIIPVFLGMALLVDHLDDAEVEYLKKFQPIGCRDQYTMETLRKYNILCYLNGCMTATFPKREREPEEQTGKIFCIDVTDNFAKEIPEEIRKECIFSNHVYMSEECPNGSEAKARQVYDMYRNEAKMIITTRLHAALPCAAMGIPVILAKEQLSYRFAIIEKLMHVYSEDEFKNINWKPEAVEYEEFKRRILDNAAHRVMDAYNKYKDMFEISEFYEGDTSRTDYFEAISDAIDYLNYNYAPEDTFKYCLWAVTQTAKMVNKYISMHFPNAELQAVIDKTKRIEFCGVQVTDKSWIGEHKETLCLVCAPAAMPEAREYFKAINHKNYLLCWQDNLPR